MDEDSAIVQLANQSIELNKSFFETPANKITLKISTEADLIDVIMAVAKQRFNNIVNSSNQKEISIFKRNTRENLSKIKYPGKLDSWIWYQNIILSLTIEVQTVIKCDMQITNLVFQKWCLFTNDITSNSYEFETTKYKPPDTLSNIINESLRQITASNSKLEKDYATIKLSIFPQDLNDFEFTSTEGNSNCGFGVLTKLKSTTKPFHESSIVKSLNELTNFKIDPLIHTSLSSAALAFDNIATKAYSGRARDDKRLVQQIIDIYSKQLLQGQSNHNNNSSVWNLLSFHFTTHIPSTIQEVYHIVLELESCRANRFPTNSLSKVIRHNAEERNVALLADDDYASDEATTKNKNKNKNKTTKKKTFQAKPTRKCKFCNSSVFHWDGDCTDIKAMEKYDKDNATAEGAKIIAARTRKKIALLSKEKDSDEIESVESSSDHDSDSDSDSSELDESNAYHAAHRGINLHLDKTVQSSDDSNHKSKKKVKVKKRN